MKSKKLMSLLLALVMVFSMLPIAGAWADPERLHVRFVDELVSDYGMSFYLEPGLGLAAGMADFYSELPVLEDQDGWHFVGWSMRSGGTREDLVDVEEPLTTDCFLYATWERVLDELAVTIEPGVTSTPGESDLPASTGGWPYRCAVSVRGWYASAADAESGEDVLNADLQPGHTYYGKMVLLPDDCYAFSEDTEIKLPAGYSVVDKTLELTEDGATKLNAVVSYTVPSASATINSVELFVQTVEPFAYVEWGVDRFCLSAGVSSQLSDSWWASEADVLDYYQTLDPEDTFQPGQRYYSCFDLLAENGAVFGENVNVGLDGGEVISAEANGSTLTVIYAVDVPDVKNVTVMSSALSESLPESPGAFYCDFAPYWSESTNGMLMPKGEHVFTAKPRCDFAFDGWYLVQHNAGTEQLLSKQLTASLSTEGGDFIVCRFKSLEEIDLAVCDVNVTAENADDILEDGAFSFADGVLTVKDDCSYAGTVIYNRLDGLVIEPVCDVTLTNSGENSGRPVMQVCADTVITGDSLLKIRSAGPMGGISVANNADLCLQDTSVDVLARNMALAGNEGEETLTVNHSNLTAKIENEHFFAINFFGQIILNECEIVTPEEALNLNGTIFQGDLENRSAANEVVILAEGGIEPEEALLICGVPVTPDNATDVLGDGVFSYDEALKQLTVSGDCSYEGTVIDSSIEGLTINVAGDSTLEDTETSTAIMGYALRLRRFTVITGGRLNVAAGKDTGGIRLHDNCTLLLDHADVSVEADMMCIAGQPNGEDGYAGFVIIDRSDLSLHTRKDGLNAMASLYGLSVKDSVVVKPEDGAFTEGAFCHYDDSAANEVEFRALPEGELLICHQAVTPENAADVLGDGVFSYDAEQKELTVNGDCSFKGTVILSFIEDLTINVTGDSRLTNEKKGTFGTEKVLKLLGDTTVTGAGHLTLNSGINAVGIAVVNEAALTLDHATLTVNSKSQCITGNEGGETLAIVASEVDLHAVPEHASAITWFDQLTLTDCHIVYPTDAELIDEEIILAGGKPVHELIISAKSETPAYYTVTFDTNGHGGDPFTRVAEAGQPVDVPASPDEDGWFFGGWFLEKDCKTAYVFTAPVTGDLTLYAKWAKLNKPLSFLDVPETAYFFRPIRWAFALEIVNGISATRFAPNDVCTRAQIMTIIWRAKGCPEPTVQENPFVDVKEGSYYYKAVLWAAENGITNGIDASHFVPDQSCTRGHAVTFLWRGAGCPEPKNNSNPFTDVAAGRFYYKAVLWAVETGVTKGVTETTFCPDNTCLRGQIVTFLYRHIVNED